MKYFREIIAPSFFALSLIGCKDSDKIASEFTDEKITITALGERDIPLRLLTPENCRKCPLVIFSHGANAAYDRYDQLLLPLAEAGYRVAIPNHTDSEEHPNRSDFKAPNWTPNRLEDYMTIASLYETDYLIAAGHSFGALIAQIAGGAKMPNLPDLDIPLPDAVIAYSPPGPVPNYIPAKTWDTITVPTLVTTGTTDIVPLMAERWDLHLASYQSVPAELSYALIYEGMDHYMNGAYGRETGSETPERKQSMEHLVQSTLSFMDDVKNEHPPSKAGWQALERSFVDARSNHE